MVEQLKAVPRDILTYQPRITSDDVCRLIDLRSRLWSAKTPTERADVCSEYGMQVGSSDVVDPASKKELFSRYFIENYPHSTSPQEHHHKLDNAVNELVGHLARNKSLATLWVFGSYAKGKINGTHSDLDFIMGLPHTTDPSTLQNEIENFRALGASHYVFAEKRGPFENMAPIMEQGTGLSRLYAMTQDGLEAEFHVLGNKDLKSLHKIWPGQVKRVQSVPPKDELRISFRGVRQPLPKASDQVDHHIRHNGEVFKGFFPDNLSTAKLIYDPTGEGAEVQSNVMNAMIKGFLYHNDGYKRTIGDQIYIDLKAVPFNKFVQTLYYNKESDYDPRRLAEIERDYYQSLARIAMRYNIHLSS